MIKVQFPKQKVEVSKQEVTTKKCANTNKYDPIVTQEIYDQFIGNRIKKGSIIKIFNKYRKAYGNEGILNEELTVESIVVRNLGSRLNGNYYVPVVYVDEYKDRPFPLHHFNVIKI